MNEIHPDFRDAWGNNIFYYCRRHNTTIYIEYFRTEGFDLFHENSLKQDFLNFAVVEGSELIVDYLFEHGYTYYPTDNLTLRESIISKNINLIEYFANQEKDYINNLHLGQPILNNILQFYDNSEIDKLKNIITIMIKNGYDINAYDADGHNVLAECDRNVELFEFLIDVGVRKKFSGESQQTL